LADTCTSHGVNGKDEVIAAKKRHFSTDPGPEGLFYSLDTFTVDNKSRMVAFTYACTTPGREGRGTELAFFSNCLKIERVVSVRHSQTQPAWAANQWISAEQTVVFGTDN